MTSRRVVRLFALAAFATWLTACGGGSKTPPTPPAAISVALSPAAPASLVAGGTASLIAVVSNDSSNAGVKWTVSCGGSSCGSFSSASTPSGIATTYTAPSAPPSPATVTVTATSATDTTKTASATIAINAISVALNPAPPTSLIAGTTASLTAVVTNDSSNGGVKWTVACSSSACGSFAPTSTASGAATTYTAPATPPSPATVTVTATSATDPSKSASATITITAASAGVSVALSPTPPTSLAVNATASLTAVVTNDSANAGVKWTVTCGGTACGSFSSTSTASGTATTYTAPSAPPSPATVSVTATSVTDTTKTATATITITNLLANGTYVYHLAGDDATGPYFVAGAITVQNGAITGGRQDFSDVTNFYTNDLVASGSSLTAAGSNLQIVLNTGNTAIGVGGVETLRGVRVSGSRVLISEFDTFASATGSLDLQTSTAAPSGGYAFSVRGTDTQQFALAIGGVLNINGSSVVVANSVLDYNDGGTVGKGLFFSSGSVSTPDSFGRITITLTPNTSGLLGFILTGYIVGTNQIQLVASQMDPLGGDLGGMALGQGTHTGNFSTASVSGSTYVFTGVGADANSSLHIGGALVLNSNNTVSGTIALNDFSTFGSASIAGGNYIVDSTGRVSITNVTPSLVQGTPFAFELYLDGNGNAMEIGLDSSQLNEAQAYQQTVSSTASFAGTYALSGQGFGNFADAVPAWGAVGPAVVASSALTGFTDYNLQGGTPTSNVTLTGTETSSTATLAVTGLNAATLSMSDSYVYLPIDSKRVIAIQDDGNQLGLLLLEGVGP